jgi:hypothetical protein
MVSVANRLVQVNLRTPKYHKKYTTNVSSIADPDPVSGSGYGLRKAKMAKRKNI